MFDWLITSAKDLPVWGQILLDVFKILVGFGTVILLTRWTLSRADRKDAISRQANALDSYSARRITNLNEAVVALSKIWNEMNKVFGALSSSREVFDKAEIINDLLSKTEEHIDQLMFALEEYGSPPGSIPSDYSYSSEALIPWLERFYKYRDGIVSPQSIAIVIGMCTDLQNQLRWLALYELNMRLQVGLNPASAWSADFGSVLESASLEFFTKDHPFSTGKPVRIIGTIVEQSSEEDASRKKREAKRVLVLGRDLSEDLK